MPLDYLATSSDGWVQLLVGLVTRDESKWLFFKNKKNNNNKKLSNLAIRDQNKCLFI